MEDSLDNDILIKIIEADDIDNFKIHFNLENWKDSITSIANYAGTSQHISTLTYNDCDCIKYALHCNAEKIFNYLLPLVDVGKHGENYGWPLLAMAIKNEQYEYAHQIVNHPTFDLYPLYHTNVFTYFRHRAQLQKHIDLLFDYLEKFDQSIFQGEHFLYVFSQLICHSEETFNRSDLFYKKLLKNNTVSILDIYKNNFDILAKEILNRKFNPFILDKLSEEELEVMISSVIDQDIFFVPLFESKEAKEGLIYLLKFPELLQKNIDKNQVIYSYLSLDNILFLMSNNIDFWKENDNKRIPLDYMLLNSDLEDETTLFLMNNYTQKIYDRLTLQDRKNNIQKYCHQKLLNEKLPAKSEKPIYKKI